MNRYSELELIISFVGLLLLIRAIYTSSRRLASLGYAILAVGLLVALGLVSMFVLIPSDASVVQTNSVLDKIGRAMNIGALVAAVWAAHKPPRRVKT